MTLAVAIPVAGLILTLVGLLWAAYCRWAAHEEHIDATLSTALTGFLRFEQERGVEARAASTAVITALAQLDLDHLPECRRHAEAGGVLLDAGPAKRELTEELAARRRSRGISRLLHRPQRPR